MAHNSNTVVRLLLIIGAALVLFSLLTYYNRNKSEKFDTPSPTNFQPLLSSASGGMASPLPSNDSGAASYAAPFLPPSPVEAAGNEKYRATCSGGAAAPREPFPQDRVTPEELLPRDAANTKWAQANPAGQGDVKDQNFITAGYHMGVDTQGQSLRNASHDIRSTEPNPRYKVSIWQNATIEPDMSRRPLE
jgi:hypothetical protein